MDFLSETNVDDDDNVGLKLIYVPSTANLDVRKSHQNPANFSKATAIKVYQLRHCE